MPDLPQFSPAWTKAFHHALKTRQHDDAKARYAKFAEAFGLSAASDHETDFLDGVFRPRLWSSAARFRNLARSWEQFDRAAPAASVHEYDWAVSTLAGALLCLGFSPEVIRDQLIVLEIRRDARPGYSSHGAAEAPLEEVQLGTGQHFSGQLVVSLGDNTLEAVHKRLRALPEISGPEISGPEISGPEISGPDAPLDGRRSRRPRLAFDSPEAKQFRASILK